ncbi:MAG: SUMF1/EgtB/PvdO family nonheme iron enzyme [Planctomycetota bacterium]
MSKTGTIVLGSLAAAGIALGSTGVYLGYMNQPRKAVEGELEQLDLTEIAGVTVDPNAGDLAVALSNQGETPNTDVRWFCGKAGTAKPYEGTWDQIAGAVAFNPAGRGLIALELTFLLDSFTGAGKEQPAPIALTNTVRDGWFDIQSHPVARFTATKAVPRAETGDEAASDAGMVEDWSHIIHGTFDLNGVEQELAVPARLVMSGELFAIRADFSIDRGAYNIDGDAAGSVVDDEVRITVSVEASLAEDAATRRLVDKLNRQAETIATQQMRLAQLEREVAFLREQEAVTSPRVNTLWQTDLGREAELPARFTDRVPYDTPSPPRFDMVLVPGDPAGQIEPFYMATNEVSWAMFETWAYSQDIGPDLSAKLQALDLRPSPLYGGAKPLEIGLGRRPALGMSRATAMAYCRWLSEQTGRTYRLPTEAEWEHALKLGGGVPADREALLTQACFAESSKPYEDSNTLFDPFSEVKLSTNPSDTTPPNALGIRDMLGNAAEWVTPAQAPLSKVRGGHFKMSVEDFTPDWHAYENPEVWNASYPQKPLSRFWYADYYYTGFRLVCEPVNVPEGR